MRSGHLWKPLPREVVCNPEERVRSALPARSPTRIAECMGGIMSQIRDNRTRKIVNLSTPRRGKPRTEAKNHSGEWAPNPGPDRTGSEFPAKCAGNPCQACQSRGRSWVGVESPWQFFMSFRGPKAHPNRPGGLSHLYTAIDSGNHP